jgi:hypothetical protein
MPQAKQVRALKENLNLIFETLFRTKEIDRPTLLAYQNMLRESSKMKYLATTLYGPKREVVIPEEPSVKLVLLSMRETDGGEFDLAVLQKVNKAASITQPLRCLIGHRFTKLIEETFRWNLRQLFPILEIEEDYSGFDGAAVGIIEDLLNKISGYDFCLFDNRDTTNPSKPNVYIEAGMAFALRRPFIFCHYGNEVWPTDFSNTNYISYQNYRELFQQLWAVLPIFLAKKVRPRK